MSFSAITKRNLRINGIILIWSVIIGAIIGLARNTSGDPLQDLAGGALVGVLIGLGSSISEMWLLSNPRLRITRRLPPLVLALLRSIIFMVVIGLSLNAPNYIAGDPPIWQGPDFHSIFGISMLVAFGISTFVEITRLLGPEAMLSLLTGRYHRPRLEDRVVMFADVVGSTSYAEQVDELTFHRFLADIYQDVASAIAATRGNVHRYVGDEVIVTWPLARGTETGACLTCAQAMHAALARRQNYYARRYNTQPRLRIALHSGQVAAGEIGDWKKEIALLGDTMNTTARIESAAKTLGAETALSDALVQHLPEDSRASLHRLPDYKAAGKEEDLTLWAAKP